MKKYLYIFIFIFFIQYTYGQVETTFFPQTKAFDQIDIIKKQPRPNKVKKFPLFDVQQFLNEDDTTKGLDKPFRFGKGFDTHITLEDGEWTDLDNGRLWSMGFESKGAYSINFVFDNFYLPEGAELYI